MFDKTFPKTITLVGRHDSCGLMSRKLVSDPEFALYKLYRKALNAQVNAYMKAAESMDQDLYEKLFSPSAAHVLHTSEQQLHEFFGWSKWDIRTTWRKASERQLKAFAIKDQL